MKKIKISLIAIISIFIFSINALAASGNLSVSTGSVYVGETFTVTANINSAAAWNVHVSASGPVSGCTINQADATADAMDTNKTFTAACTATGEGTINIILSGDVTSAVDGNAVKISGSKSVNVSKKPEPTPTPKSQPQPQPSNPEQTTKSSNNKLKEISIEGYELVKVDDHNYTLSVANNVENITVKATAEDTKAKITGAGKHDIKVGENTVELVVTAENGSQNKISIKITKKDGYYLDDLEAALKDSSLKDINITIEANTKISASDLNKIKASKKTVHFNVYNDSKNLLYSWIIDGSKIKDTNDFLTTISDDSETKKDILKLSNYADGVVVGLKQTNSLPEGIKLKLFVGDKYQANDLVNIYKKNNDTLEIDKKEVSIEKGYIEFELEDATDYFITMSTIESQDKKEVTTTGSNSFDSISLIIIGVLSLLVVILLIVLLTKGKKNKKDKPKKNNNKVVTNNAESKINDDIPINTDPTKNVSNNSTTYDEWFK